SCRARRRKCHWGPQMRGEDASPGPRRWPERGRDRMMRTSVHLHDRDCTMILRVLLAAIIAVTAVVRVAHAQQTQTVYIHAGRVLADPESGRVETQKTIVVTGGTV